MKVLLRLSLGLWFRSLSTLSFLLLFSPCAQAVTFVIEPELFDLPGGWERTEVPWSDTSRKYLTAASFAKDAPAYGGVLIPHAGKWRLWARTKDFPTDRPGSRNFSISVAGQRSPRTFGQHGQEGLNGWEWEDGGVFELPAGEVLVALGETVKSSARCDALVLSDNQSFVPSGVPWKLGKTPATLAHIPLDEQSLRAILPETYQKIEAATVAMLENEAVRLTFHRAMTKSGEAIALRAETRDGDRWVPLTDDPNPESYRVLYRPADSEPNFVHRVYPTWDLSFSPFVEGQLGGVRVRTRLGIPTAPWASAKCLALRPINAVQRDANTVELTFSDTPEGRLSAVWHMSTGQPAAALELHFIPAARGYFSLGYHAPLAIPPADADFLLLPFMVQGRRFPEQPVTMVNTLTPTPLSLVNKGGVSCAVVAEPGELSFEWPNSTNARYALALRNEAGLAQPLIYSPVLGLSGSRSDGTEVKTRLRLWLQRGNWNDAYQGIAKQVFELHDYRKPLTASLSDAALNLVDLMRNEEASGWDARAKGPWNIESRNTISQSSPLAYLSLYLLTGDEDFYHRFARPSLEFLLSRPGPHFAAEREISDNYYKHQPLRGPGSFFGASTFAAAFTMTQGESPVFGSLCLDDKGEPRTMHGNSHTQSFADLLALHRSTGDPHWLAEAVGAADQYLAANFSTLPTRDPGPQPFINVSFIPDWEGLLHLYETTGEPRFLAAAREGARWMNTTLWTQPVIPCGDILIHPKSRYDANRHIWWFGDQLFRRGIYKGPWSKENPKTEPPSLPEKRVPAWAVSQVGLGLEQPVTYTRKGSQANIFMSAWAPSMLRLATLGKEEAFRTAARNAVIGRFANYPGYYCDGFTTEYQRLDYPVNGPDVTSLYVHHIPSFAAFVVDYLLTDAEMRSGVEVKFPSTRQCGYVWFDSRLYGHAPGSVYGESAWPWLHPTAARSDTINADVILAEGGGKFHVVLLNQVREQQRVRVSFDDKALGRSVEGAQLKLYRDNQTAPYVQVKNGIAEVTLSPLGIAALTLEGVKINVPTHRVVPPATIPLPQKSSQQIAPLGDTGYKAIANLLQVSPFAWRDLFVYLDAAIDDCRAATLRYHVGDGPEERIEKREFPWEFTVHTKELDSQISWQLDVELSDGRRVTTLGARP